MRSIGKKKSRELFILYSLVFLLSVACAVLGAPQAQATQPVVIQPTASLATLAPSATAASSVMSSPTALPNPTATALPTETPLPSASPTPEVVRFAVIGDYGEGNQSELDVANLVKGWNPDFIITVGDNNYPSGSAETIDHRIGQYYHEFIYPYHGAYGVGADENRFFPTLGNHDWDISRAQAYFDYFTLLGNERYYEFIWGPVHFFALSSDSREPDGVGASSVQAAWLRERLAISEAIWKLVYGHHPPYSSGPRDPVTWIRWPFQEWGATTYLAGHDHFYERLVVNGFPYFVNGLGGGPIYAFGPVADGSEVRYNADYGAMLVIADHQRIIFQFVTRLGEVIDTYQIDASDS